MMLRALRGTSQFIVSTIMLALLVLQMRNISCDRSKITRLDRKDLYHYRGQDLVDWSRFAYSQYATNTAYLCNSVMIFETLHRLNSRADRLLMYPSRFSTDENDNGTESRLLRQARDEFNVKLVPTHVQTRHGGDRMCCLIQA